MPAAISSKERAAAAIWPAEGVAREITDRLGYESATLRPLQWKQGQGTPLYYLETEEGRFVLKLATPRSERRPAPLREHLTREEIDLQARVLEQLGAADYHHLQVPRLIASDHRTYLLVEYLETVAHKEADVPRAELLGSLLEFQASDIELSRSALTRFGREPGVLLARQLLGALRSRIGWRAVGRALAVMRRCYRAQPPLPRPVLRHNDFHYNNLMLTKEGRLYFTDFEYVAYDRRWPLGDIAHFAVGTKEYGVDGGLIFEYAGLLQAALGLELDLEAQLRFSLLLRVGQQILSGSVPPEASARYQRLFTEVLIDDQRFRNWLQRAALDAAGSTW